MESLIDRAAERNRLNTHQLIGSAWDYAIIVLPTIREEAHAVRSAGPPNWLRYKINLVRRRVIDRVEDKTPIIRHAQIGNSEWPYTFTLLPPKPVHILDLTPYIHDRRQRVLEWQNTCQRLYRPNPGNQWTRQANLVRSANVGVANRNWLRGLEEQAKREEIEVTLAMRKMFRLPRRRVPKKPKSLNPWDVKYAQVQELPQTGYWITPQFTTPGPVRISDVSSVQPAVGASVTPKRAQVNFKTNKEGEDASELLKLTKFKVKRVPIWKKYTDTDLYHYLKLEAAFLEKDRSLALVLKLKAKRFLREFDMRDYTLKQQQQMITNAVTLVIKEDNAYGINFEDFRSRGNLRKIGYIAAYMLLRSRHYINYGQVVKTSIPYIPLVASYSQRIILGDMSDLTTTSINMATYIKSVGSTAVHLLKSTAVASTMSSLRSVIGTYVM